MSKDRIYSIPQDTVEPFRFDKTVADVFPDMLQRSIPGYALIQEMIAVLAKHYAQKESHIYDLGCSLGASSISMLSQINEKSIKLIGVDNSEAMIDGAKIALKQYCEEHNNETHVELRCEDIEQTFISNASIVNLNFTLQFINPAQRKTLIEKIYQGLRPGGILIVSEKVCFEAEEDELLAALHHDFKRAKGYSDLEISQKRTAIENVLIRDSETDHHQRLQAAGFTQNLTWFQCFNFLSLLAIKTG